MEPTYTLYNQKLELDYSQGEIRLMIQEYCINRYPIGITPDAFYSIIMNDAIKNGRFKGYEKEVYYCDSDLTENSKDKIDAAIDYLIKDNKIVYSYARGTIKQLVH